MRRFWVKAYLDRHDLWVGVYWKREPMEGVLPPALRAYGPRKFYDTLTIYLCVLPCCVVRFRLVAGEGMGR